MARRKPLPPQMQDKDFDLLYEYLEEFKTPAHCGNCKCWKKVSDTLGECHRYPPSYTREILSEGQLGAWKLTRKSDYCYEHMEMI